MRPLFSVLFAATACAPADELQWGAETLEWKGEVCSEASCPLARLTRPSFEEAFLAEEVDAWIAASDLYGLPGQVSDTEEAMEAFVRSGEEEDEWGLPSWWYTLVDVQVDLAQGGLLSLSRYTDIYTGGVHGLQREDYLVLDTRTGDSLSLEDIIEPSGMAPFRKIAKAEFERQNGLIEEFWFDSGDFSFPKSESGFGISPDGLEFAWSLYEINCYAYGIPRLSIPWERVEHLLDWEGALFGLEPARR
jgi:hypothetical protein